MLAVLGKTLGAAKGIAVVKRSNYLGMTNYIPVDAIVNRNQTLADVIIKNVRYPGSSKVLTVFEEISAETLEITIAPDSPAVGRSLADMKMPAGSVIGMLERDKTVLIPTGNSILAAGDKVAIFASTEVMPLAIQKFGEISQ